MTDPLDRFSAALAAKYDGQVPLPAVTRTRIVEGLSRRRARRSNWRVLLAIPLFAFVGGTALAATGRLPTSLEPLVEWLVPVSPPPEVAAPAPAPSKRAAPPASLDQAPSAAPAAPEKTTVRSLAELADAGLPDGSPAETLAIAVRRPRAPQPVGASHPASARAAQADPTLATYAAAQRAQFREADCVTAVRRYEHYLTEAPSGSFSVEARYNRSLCLIRLGRSEEARATLHDFARGQYGDYRQLEAKHLLQATEE